MKLCGQEVSMEVYELINKRTSIRAYKPDSVPMEALIRITDAARRAPSWCNKQCWRFVIVDSKVEKKLIGKASGQDNIAKACEGAPCVVVLCANPKESGAKNGMEYYMFDCALAMENLILAAMGEGLSTCVVGWFDEKAVKAVLNIPDDFRAVAFTPLGYAAEAVAPRSRKKQEDVVFYNSWGKTIGSKE